MKKHASSSAMESRRRNVSESPQTNLRLSADELLSNLPTDLVMEIFSRLPLKSIARCRCVSKRWASVLRRPEFTELFLTKSLARPQLLFARPEESEVMFFSSPQLQNPDENLSTRAIDHHMTLSFESVQGESIQDVSSCVNGYVFITDYRMSKARETEEEELVHVICNPSTGQRLDLPKTKVTEMRCFFGDDPVEKQHKVLGMTKRDDGRVYEHQVLTLSGNGNMTWRFVECGGINHYFSRRECVCVNGVLYYIADAINGDDMIVCFDVRSEKFSSVKAMERGLLYVTLINFQGKLASLTPQPDPFYLGGTTTSFEIWVLEDPEKHEWSKRVFSLPPTWKDVVAAGEELYFAGVTDTNEFVISPEFPSNTYHFYCYNFIKESIRRVEIQGMGAFEMGSVFVTFLNHVEDVKLM